MPATRKLSRFLAPYWQWALLAPLMMVLEVAMDLMQPRLIQQIIDGGISFVIAHRLSTIRAEISPSPQVLQNVSAIS